MSDQITHPKQHKSFFWDNVIERSHCTYNPLDVTPVNVSLHSELVALEITGARSDTALNSSSLFVTCEYNRCSVCSFLTRVIMRQCKS